MSHKLMIKTHNITGLKYLCYTQKEGKKYDNYLGSGKYWLQHLKKHGKYISTELIFETDNFKEFQKFALNMSIELNVHNSDEWANLMLETGGNGSPSNETRKKLSMYTPWIKGKHHSDYTKKILSLHNKNKIVSEDTKTKLKIANLGKRHSDSTKEKIRNKHLNLSKESRIKMREAQLGKKLTEEHKKSIGLSSIGRYKGSFFATDGVKNYKVYELTGNLIKGLTRKKKNKPYECKYIYINNGCINKKIKITSEIPDDWFRGRLKK